MDEALLHYIKHLSKTDKKTLSQKSLKTAEEVGELAKATLPYDNAFATNHRFVGREKVLEEVVDTMLSAMSVAYDLDFNDEDIEQMMWRKAKYWDTLQQNEKDLKYPIPFEVHITVEPTDEATKRVGMFRAVCAQMIGNVKPIILDLHNASGKITQDIMTSSKVFGTNTQALREMEYVSSQLEQHRYKVIRKKIETVPWHPAAPQGMFDAMPPNCYFEAHIPIVLYSQEQIPEIAEKCAAQNLHLSRNVFKKDKDGKMIIMATYRQDKTYNGPFQTDTAVRVKHLQASGVKILDEKIHTEFSIYDTNLSHDASWLGKQDEL